MRVASYLRYLAKRKNEFGIHSPFVFKLYTEVIKRGRWDRLKALGIEKVKEVEAGSFDEVLDPSVMYVVKGIHDHKDNEAYWDTICGRPDVTLTIDLYHKGLFFYREGMEKQGFVLKS